MFSKGVLDCHLIVNEPQKIAAGGSYFLAVSVGSDEVTFERPNVADYNHFQIFEFAVGIAIEESLYTTTDVVLANIAFAKCVGSDRRMVDAVLGEEAGDQIGVLSTRLQILRPARASFLRTFIPHKQYESDFAECAF